MDNFPNGKTAAEDNAREIPKWARRYAQSRTLPFLFYMAVFIVMCVAIGGSSLLAGIAFMLGHWIAFGFCLALLLAAIVVNIWLSIPSKGAQWMRRAGERLYGDEGVTSLEPANKGREWKRLSWIVGGVFVCCVVGSVVAGVLGAYPRNYMQPVSALYSVPFLLIIYFLQRPMGSPIMLLWPFLFALHAVLVVAGAPIQFHGAWEGLNMLIPVAGYGTVTGLAGHVYNRYALRRLRRAAGAGLGRAEPGPAQPPQEEARP